MGMTFGVRRPLAALVLLAAGCSQTPANIEVEPAAIRFRGSGEQLAILGRVVDVKGMPIPGKALYFTSSDPTIASVRADGTVTAVGAGQTQIWISHDKLNVSVPVRVSIPRKVVLEGRCGTRCRVVGQHPPSFHFEGLQATGALQAQVLDEQDEPIDVPVRFQAADPEYATGARKLGIAVNAAGELESLAVGRYTVVASAGGAAEKVMVEVVLPHVDEVRAPASLWLKPGET
ncbi:MAG: Ig domain-containing protein, partial [Myxococcales bacterium]